MSEGRIRWLFGFLVAAQLLMLAAQLPAAGGPGSYLEAGLLRLVAPVGRVIVGAGGAVGYLAQEVALRRSLVADNRRLRDRVEELEQESTRHLGQDEDLRRLGWAVEYARSSPWEVEAADVVHIDHGSWLQTLVLHVLPDRQRVNQPVVTSRGLVGRVVVASGPWAKVQLISDRAASVGAMIRRTRRQGVLRGTGSGRLVLDFVPLQADVRTGDEVVTAGIDGIYPRGISIGRVTAVERGSELFHRIEVAPTVDLGVIDQVYLLKLSPIPEEMRRARADAHP